MRLDRFAAAEYSGFKGPYCPHNTLSASAIPDAWNSAARVVSLANRHNLRSKMELRQLWSLYFQMTKAIIKNHAVIDVVGMYTNIGNQVNRIFRMRCLYD